MIYLFWFLVFLVHVFHVKIPHALLIYILVISYILTNGFDILDNLVS